MNADGYATSLKRWIFAIIKTNAIAQRGRGVVPFSFKISAVAYFLFDVLWPLGISRNGLSYQHLNQQCQHSNLLTKNDYPNTVFSSTCGTC